MHILVASWDILDSIFLWPSSIAFPANTYGNQVASLSLFSTSDRLLLLRIYVGILTTYVIKESDEEKGWHIEINIGISSM